MITDKVIKEVTLEQYLMLLNKEGSNLVADLDHWAEYGVTTAQQLADYLDNEYMANLDDEPDDGYDYDRYY